MIKLKKCKRKDNKLDKVYLLNVKYELTQIDLLNDSKILDYIRRKREQKQDIINVNLFTQNIWLVFYDPSEEKLKALNKVRKNAYNLVSQLNANKVERVLVEELDVPPEITIPFVEALSLSNYQFIKYKTQDIDHKKNTLREIKVLTKKIQGSEFEKLQVIIDAVYITRDLVNTSYRELNSLTLVDKIKKLSKEAGFKIEVLDKKKIEALKMGGLLAVNQGSDVPPTFSILKWKPSKSKNSKPIILVGKGVMFDSGGLNLKPTGYIEDMKMDMAGAAAVIGTMYAVAKLNLPIYVIGLIPATDNAISNKSYAPGDVITMHNGLTVEVLNTDAEGRLILADALAYAKKYDPQLVIDLATLTGSAMMALGHPADAMFSNADEKIKQTIIDAGYNTYERLVEFPLWEEYDQMLKSDIADIKNIAGRQAGLITAAKFLEHFIDYNWIHLDIAPNAFLDKKMDFRGQGATGIGVRLLLEFFKQYFSLT